MKPLIAIACATLFLLVSTPALAADPVPFRPGGVSQPCWNINATAPDTSTVVVCTPGYVSVDPATGLPATGGGTGGSASQVQGTAADGAVAIGNPVQTAGKDGSGNIQAILTDTTGAQIVQASGDVASGVADNGNPLKAGCRGSTTALTAVTANQRANVWCGLNGQVSTMLSDTSGAVMVLAPTNASLTPSGTATSIRSSSLTYCFDGTSWIMGSAVCPSTATSAGLTPVVTSVVGGSLVLKASAGNLYSIDITTGASAGYLMVFNATTAPADGVVTPAVCMPIAASTGLSRTYAVPAVFATGITAVFSTTGCFLKTVSATAFISGQAK